MKKELETLIDKIKDAALREKVRELLNVPDIELKGAPLPLSEAPGGAFMHHSYKGGLLQHTISMTHIALTLCDMVENVYGGEVDRDVVLAGALIHDIMKCYVYREVEEGKFRTSPLGEKIDHLTLLVSKLLEQDFPIDIIHVAASHHGEKSPVRPKTLEALIVSIADLADSEFSRQSLRAAEYLVRETRGSRKNFTSSEEVLKLLRVKAREGWEGVNKFNTGEK
jgi:7,8-dihydroneopterin 2',3'-cyclic phosphate phosphodiesterase